MSDLLIRKIDPRLKRQIKERAHAHGRSLSDEAKALLAKALAQQDDRRLGSEIFDLVPQEARGDDLVFEYDEPMREPPDFK